LTEVFHPSQCEPDVNHAELSNSSFDWKNVIF